MPRTPEQIEERRQIAHRAALASSKAAARRRHEKWAEEMRAAGWIVAPPEQPSE